MKKLFILCLVAWLSVKLFSMETVPENGEVSDEQRALVSAIRVGNFDVVYELIFNQQVSPFFLIEFKRNLLHVAMLPSSRLSFDIVNLIIKIFDREDNPDKSSFSVNSQEVFGNTPLHFLALRRTCKNKDQYVLDEILKKLNKSDVNFAMGDRYKKCPLDLAKKHCGLTMISLVKNYPKLEEKDKIKLLKNATKLIETNCDKTVECEDSAVFVKPSQSGPSKQTTRKPVRKKSKFFDKFRIKK